MDQIMEISKKIMESDCFDPYDYMDNDYPSIPELIKERPLDVIEWLLDALEEAEERNDSMLESLRWME